MLAGTPGLPTPRALPDRYIFFYIYISLSLSLSYSTPTIPKGARRVDRQARSGYSSAGIDHRGLLFFLGGPGRH